MHALRILPQCLGILRNFLRINLLEDIRRHHLTLRGGFYNRLPCIRGHRDHKPKLEEPFLETSPFEEDLRYRGRAIARVLNFPHSAPTEERIEPSRSVSTLIFESCPSVMNRLYCGDILTFCSRRNFSSCSDDEKFISRETARHLRIFFGTLASCSTPDFDLRSGTERYGIFTGGYSELRGPQHFMLKSSRLSRSPKMLRDI